MLAEKNRLTIFHKLHHDSGCNVRAVLVKDNGFCNAGDAVGDVRMREGAHRCEGTCRTSQSAPVNNVGTGE